MKHKMRITLLDEQGVLKSDRLVDQYTELLQGPTDKHDAPYRLEVVIDSAETKNRVVQYLEKLAGNLPIPIRGTSSPINTPNSVNPYKELIASVKKHEHVEDTIAFLESINFRFVTFQLLEEFEAEKKFDFSVNREVYNSYQWMVRILRHAKDPANDRFDFKLMFGIKFIGKRKQLIYVFYKGKKYAIIKKMWKKLSNINIKAKKVSLVFPSYMTIDERKRWRYMRRKVEAGKVLGPRDDQFYQRYLPEVKNLETQGNLKNQ